MDSEEIYNFICKELYNMLTKLFSDYGIPASAPIICLTNEYYFGKKLTQD